MNEWLITMALIVVTNYDIFIYTECLLIKESTKKYTLSLLQKRKYLIYQINITTTKTWKSNNNNLHNVYSNAVTKKENIFCKQ